MAQLRSEYHEFVKRGAEIITIGPENEKAFASWWHEHVMPFVGLADPDHSVSALYGQQVKIFKLGRMPAQLIVDKNGLIRFKHYGNSMSDIPENSEILSKIDELNEGSAISSK
jgi:peroxiredoxin